MSLFGGAGGGDDGLLGGVTGLFHGAMGGIFGQGPQTAPTNPLPASVGQTPAWPGAPVPQGVYNVGSYPGFQGSLAGPGPMEGYWDQVQRQRVPNQAGDYFNRIQNQRAPQGSNLATGAYNQFQQTAPMNTDPFYNRAMQRASNAVGQNFAAMGMGNSGAAQSAQADVIANLLGQQAKEEAQYGLARGGVAGSLARGGDISSQANAQNQLGWTFGLGNLASNAQSAALANMLGLGNIANQAQNQLSGRAQGYFNNLLNMANAQAGAQMGITMPMLQTQLGLLDQAMQAYLGYPRQALNQGVSDRAATEQGLGAAAGILGALGVAL